MRVSRECRHEGAKSSRTDMLMLPRHDDAFFWINGEEIQVRVMPGGMTATWKRKPAIQFCTKPAQNESKRLI